MVTGSLMEHERRDSLIGHRWRSFRVERQLAEGGMGTLYLLGHEKYPELKWVMKVINPDIANISDIHARFEQEARVAAAIGQGRVPQLHDFDFLPDGRPFIAMEYVQGRSLAEELACSGPMRLLPALRVVQCVADTMTIAHARGVIHRDLKPSNIMLMRGSDQDFVVKLLDFGIAQVTGELQLVQTAQAVAIGTRGYMSPEALAASQVDGSTDVYSLGTVLYEMLTGHLPWPPPTDADSMLFFFTAPPQALVEIRPVQLDPVPSWLERLIYQSLARQPAERPTMSEFSEQLRRSIQRLSLEADYARWSSDDSDSIPSRAVREGVPARPDGAAAFPPPGDPKVASSPGPSRVAPSDVIVAGVIAKRRRWLQWGGFALLALVLCGVALAGARASMSMSAARSQQSGKNIGSLTPTAADFGSAGVVDMSVPPTSIEYPKPHDPSVFIGIGVAGVPPAGVSNMSPPESAISTANKANVLPAKRWGAPSAKKKCVKKADGVLLCPDI